MNTMTLNIYNAEIYSTFMQMRIGLFVFTAVLLSHSDLNMFNINSPVCT